MKKCALCDRKLGLGVRFRSIWNGRWWVHVGFCSARCKAIYEDIETTLPKIAGTPSSLRQFAQLSRSSPVANSEFALAKPDLGERRPSRLVATRQKIGAG